MNNGFLKALAVMAISLAWAAPAMASIELQPARTVGQRVQQLSGISTELLAAEMGARSASRHLDDGRPKRPLAPSEPAREPGLYQPAHGRSMEGTGGVPSFRTVQGEVAIAALEAVPQRDPLVDRIRDESKLILVSADPLGLLRPPEFPKLQSLLS